MMVSSMNQVSETQNPKLLKVDFMAKKKDGLKLIVDGKRLDGRAADQLRPVRIEAHVLNDANGSAYVEWGKNRVLAGVYGPQECIPKHDASPYGALIKCRYTMASFCSLEEHGRSGPNRRSIEISKVMTDAFKSVIFTEYYPKTQIAVFVEVLQSDGGTRCAAINAASVALVDAGIPMRDMVTAVAFAKVDDQIVIDAAKEEDNFGQADVPVAIGANSKEILLLQMDGILSKEEMQQGMEYAYSAAEYLHRLQKDALERVFTTTAQEKKETFLRM